MTNKKTKNAIARLALNNDRYDLGVEAATSGVTGVQGAKAVLQIMELTEGKLTVVRRGSAYGFGKTLEEAQEQALLLTIENLGI